MIRTQQESIDTLKQMLSQLLEGGQGSKPKTPSRKSKGKRKEGESSSSVHIEEGGQSAPELPKSSSEEGGSSEGGGTHSKGTNSKRITKLEQ